MSKLIVGVNDLATQRPDLAKEWHPTKNGDLTPCDVTCGSSKEVWWLYPYDDPITGKHFDFEWQAIINNRIRNNNCPYLTSHRVWSGFNDLTITNPKIASEWHPTKNGDLLPTMVMEKSNKKVWWLYPYDDPITGKHFDFEWKTSICDRTNGNNCPYLSGQKVWVGFNDLATLRPDLAKEWHPTKNGKLTPFDVTCSGTQKVWWLYPYDDPVTGKHFDFEWQARISSRERGSGCPYINGQIKVWVGFNDLATLRPDLAKEWHPTKNGKLTPFDVTCNGTQKVWWLYPYDDPVTGKHFDFEWQTVINDRAKQQINCPYLTGHRVWVGFNDLATLRPDLAKEWHPTKNGKLTPFDVTCNGTQKVWWLSSYDDPITGKHIDFEWQAQISNRNNGTNCPYINVSRAEYFIYMLLKKNNFDFVIEKTFEKCKKQKSLRYDFFLPNQNLVIECDGIQHFEPIEFFGGKKSHNACKKSDNIKNTYCKENKIAILRIPYVYDVTTQKDVIKKMVLEFIEKRTIPEEIKDFYSQFAFSNYLECVA